MPSPVTTPRLNYPWEMKYCPFDDPRLKEMLLLGWEPFSVNYSDQTRETTVYLRRRKE